MSNIIILGIETSCDDTSVSLLVNGKIISLQNSSSLKKHAKYGGIIPEIAARNHLQQIDRLTKNVFKNTPYNLSSLTHIAYTSFPGLPGSLHIGKVFANGLAFLLKIPAIPTDHMNGHIYSFGIDTVSNIKYPFLSLVISGGNTILYSVNSATNKKILNKTTDDAVGQMLDKIGRELKLPYPGGVSIDKKYNKDEVFALINHMPAEKMFSFSGLKSMVTNLIKKNGLNKDYATKISSSVLKWVIDDIIIKLNYYFKQKKYNFISVGGGVACNNALSLALKKEFGNEIAITEKKYCGDNAAMICYYAYNFLK